MHWDTLKQGNYSTVRGDGGSRVGEVTVRDPPNHTSSLRVNIVVDRSGDVPCGAGCSRGGRTNPNRGESTDSTDGWRDPGAQHGSLALKSTGKYIPHASFTSSFATVTEAHWEIFSRLYAHTLPEAHSELFHTTTLLISHCQPEFFLSAVSCRPLTSLWAWLRLQGFFVW